MTAIMTSQEIEIIKTNLGDTSAPSKIINLSIENKIKSAHDCAFTSSICTFIRYLYENSRNKPNPIWKLRKQ